MKLFVSPKSWRHIDVLPRLNWSPNLFRVPEAARGRQPALTLDKCARIFLFRKFSLSRNHPLSLQGCNTTFSDNTSIILILFWCLNRFSSNTVTLLSASMSKSCLWEAEMSTAILLCWQLGTTFLRLEIVCLSQRRPLTPFSPRSGSCLIEFLIIFMSTTTHRQNTLLHYLLQFCSAGFRQTRS